MRADRRSRTQELRLPPSARVGMSIGMWQVTCVFKSCCCCAPEVIVLHKAFHIDGNLWVDCQRLATLLHLHLHAVARLGVAVDVEACLGLELRSKVRNKHVVEVAATQAAVPSMCFDLHLTLLERDNGHLHVDALPHMLQKL